MPKYTARLCITRNGKFQEEIWLENIRASSEREANNKAGMKANEYVATNSGGKSPPTGYNIVMCMRSKLISENEKKGGRVLQLTEVPDTRTAPVSAKGKLVISNKFEAEERGTFEDPFVFKDSLSQRVAISWPVSDWRWSGF